MSEEIDDNTQEMSAFAYALLENYEVFGNTEDEYEISTRDKLIQYIGGLESKVAELEAAQRWIPVSEPPVEGQYCAIMQLDKYGQVVEQGFAIYYGERYDYTMEVWKNITHWYPVPNWNAIELPEVQE